MSATTIDPHIVENISNDLKRQIANNDDRIQHQIEKRLISDNELKSTMNEIGLPKELGTINSDDFQDTGGFRKELNKAIDKFRTEMYQNSDANTVRKALKELEIEVNKSRDRQSDINSKHQFNKFVRSKGGENIIVPPSDELLFLGPIGAGIAFILSVAVVYVLDEFIGSGVAGTLVVVVAGSLLATVTGLMLRKVYSIIKSIHVEVK